MSYAIRPLGSSGYELCLKGESANCHALAMNPAEREAQLNKGVWLVLVFAIWSGPDRNAIETALAVGREFVGKLQVGIRPFDKKEEMTAWCPSAKLEWISPTWLLLKDGELMLEKFGPQSLQSIQTLLKGYLRE